MPKITVLLLTLLFTYNLFSQNAGAETANERLLSKNVVGKIVASLDAHLKLSPAEKIYLQTDKPWYAINDSIWFKAYVFKADFLTATTTSGLLYAELINDSDRVVKRMSFPMEVGLCRGMISLEDDEFVEGFYTLVAYTNWMRNFSEELVFKKRLYISAEPVNSLMVKNTITLEKNDGKDEVSSTLSFINFDSSAFAGKEMKLQVMDESKVLKTQNVKAFSAGNASIQFNLPKKKLSKQINVVAEQVIGIQQGPALHIPVSINRPAYTDVQFLPEGGRMIAGIACRIGFKTIGEDGNNVAISGKIFNSQNREIVSFATTHEGMGSFDMMPEKNEIYTAKVVYEDGSTISYPLPKAADTGTAMQVDNRADGDSIYVTIYSSGNLTGRFKLLGVSRNVACYAKLLQLQSGTTFVSIPKGQFPTDVAHFILFDEQDNPVNERICFITHHDELSIEIKPEKLTYKPRDSIQLQIAITDKDGQPIEGSFSLAVTDNGLVSADTSNNMLTHLLLQSNLKGYIKNPAYYFSNATNAWSDLDNLLLSQGWVGYDWPKLLSPPTGNVFMPELEFTVKGKLTNLLNKPVANQKVQLVSTRPILLLDTLSDKNGEFVFTSFPPMDTAQFLIRAVNRKDKNANAGIVMEDFKVSLYSALSVPAMPWFVNNETDFTKELAATKARNASPNFSANGANILKDVVVVGRKRVKKSKNLNGDGNADIVLNELDMYKAQKQTLQDLLTNNIKGFRVVQKPGGWLAMYIYTRPVILVIDGQATMERPRNPITGQYITDQIITEPRVPLDMSILLKNYTAEDIAGIEVMYSGKYHNPYLATFLTFDEKTKINPSKGNDPVWVEITTRNNVGPYLKLESGAHFFRPMFPTYPQRFYAPKYAVKYANPLPDFRSTIFWEPDVVTDSTGKATVSFYASDNTGQYTVILEGSDMDGGIGTKTAVIKITK